MEPFGNQKQQQIRALLGKQWVTIRRSLTASHLVLRSGGGSTQHHGRAVQAPARRPVFRISDRLEVGLRVEQGHDKSRRGSVEGYTRGAG
jgi:hypothetical protein